MFEPLLATYDTITILPRGVSCFTSRASRAMTREMTVYLPWSKTCVGMILVSFVSSHHSDNNTAWLRCFDNR
jgi:hypothetical protein